MPWYTVYKRTMCGPYTSGSLIIDTHNSEVHYEVKKNALRTGDVRPQNSV